MRTIVSLIAALVSIMAVLVSLTTPAIARAAEPVAGSWYQEFPPIPHAPWAKPRFARQLVDACKDLVDLASIPENQDAVPLRLLGSELDETERALTADRANPAPAPVDPTKYAIARRVGRLKRVCAKLMGPGTEWETLNPNDLQLLRALRDSKRFEEVVAFIQRAKEDSLLSSGPLRGGVGPALSFGGLDGGLASKAIEGLADFVVKRAKEEAIFAVQQELVGRVCEDEHGNPTEVTPFVSETCRVLTSLDGSLSLRGVGTALHAAAVADLERLPDVTLAYAIREATKQGAASVDAYVLGRIGYASYRAVRNGRDPVEVFSSIHGLVPLRCERSGRCPSVGSIRKVSALAFVLSDQDVAIAFRQATARELGVLVVGSVLESEALLTFEHGPDELVRVLKVAGNVQRAVGHFAAARAIIEELREDAGDGDGDDSDPEAEDRRRREKIAAIMVLVASGAADLSAATTASTEDPNDDAAVQEAMKVFVEVAELTGRLIVQDWGGAASASTTLVERTTDAELQKELLAFLPLIVEVANAHSSTEVAAAIEAAASPPGSYRAKYDRTTISLNAFVGGGGGFEYVASGGLRGWSGTVQGVAPIGLHVAAPFARAKRRPSKGRYHLHGGGMISLIDLGALTTHRFESELQAPGAPTTATASSAPQVGVAQIFSPGAFLTLGLARLPLVLGGGLSMSPRLRRITQSGVEPREATAVRLMVFIAIDVTLYQFR
jgi:hypothetical protein